MRTSLASALLLGSALLLSACAAGDAAVGFAEGRADTAINQAQRLKNVEAKSVRSLLCIMSVGSYYRELTAREQAAVSVLCGGDEEIPAPTTPDS